MKEKTYTVTDETTLTDLYSEIQDIADYNIKEFLQCVVLEPGLKLDEGAFDYEITDSGYLIIKLGSAVFKSYDVFIPQPGQSVRIPIADLEFENGLNIWVYLKYLEDDDEDNVWSHEYPVAPSSGISVPIGPLPDSTYERTTDVYRHGTAVIELRQDPPVDETYYLAIAKLTAAEETKRMPWLWDSRDIRNSNPLILVGAFTPLEDTYVSIIPEISDASISTTRMSRFRQEQCIVGGEVWTINNESPASSVPSTAVMTVSWDDLSDAEKASVGGVAFYRVAFHPYILIESNITMDKVRLCLLPDAMDGKIYCTEYITEGTPIVAEIRRFDNMYEPRVSQSLTVNTIPTISGIESRSWGSPLTVFDVEEQFECGSVCIIKPNASLVLDEGMYIQILVYENDGSPIVWPPTDEMMEYQGRIYYEGLLKDVLYIAPADVESVAFQLRVIAPGQIIMYTSGIRTHDIGEYESESTYLMPLYIPQDTTAGVADQVLMSFMAPRRFKVSRLKTSTGTWDTIGAGTLSLYSDNILDAYEVDYDQYGEGDTETFATEPVFDSGDEVFVRVVASGGATDFSRCMVLIYMKFLE